MCVLKINYYSIKPHSTNLLRWFQSGVIDQFFLSSGFPRFSRALQVKHTPYSWSSEKKDHTEERFLFDIALIAERLR